jgi:hypothetical protein
MQGALPIARPRHALVLHPCPALELEGLRQRAHRVTECTVADAGAGYGEVLVRAVAACIDEADPDLLVVPAPNGSDAHDRALALAGIEAARRHGGPGCTWIPAEAGVNAPWTRVEADGLLEWQLAHGRDVLACGAGSFATAAPPPAAALVSVIVRSIDRPSLATALASIVLQTHRPIEVVVVNANVARHSPLPAGRPDLAFVAVASDDGRPLPRARAANAGLDAATGPLALFLDDDDLLLPDHLARLVAALQDRPDAAAAYADVELGRSGVGGWQVAHRFEADFDPMRLLFEDYLPIHGVLFRHGAPWRQVRFDERFDLFEDWDFWLQLVVHGTFVHVAGVSTRYVASGDGQSQVFDDAPAARAARAQLYEKWHALGGPAQTRAVLQWVQALHREAAQTRAELALLRSGHEQMGAVLAARDRELANARGELARLRQVLGQREREIADAQTEIAAVRDVLDHRDREIADWIDALAGRDQELETLRATLSRTAAALAELDAEGPLRALARTLRGKPDAARS